jgi:DNA mismatch repair protein MSH2
VPALIADLLPYHRSLYMSSPAAAAVCSPVACALGLDSPAALSRYLRNVAKHVPEQGTLHLYEHLGRKQYALHGPLCIGLAARLRVEDMRAAETLPAMQDGNDPLETLTLSPRAARDLAAGALFTAGTKVVLISVKNDGNTEIKASASPGNTSPLAEYLDLDSAVTAMASRPLLDDGCVVAIKLAGTFGKGTGVSGNLGVVAWDTVRRCISLTEIHDDDAFSLLEGLLVAVNAKELLVCAGDMDEHEAGKLSSVLESCGVARTELPRSKFSDANVTTDLERLVGSSLPLVSFLDFKLAIPAAAALISFLNLTADPSNEGNVSVSKLDHAKFMHLDTAALRALNVVPFTGDGGGGKRATLYGLLNRTKTPMGSRLLRRWLAQPLQELDSINGRLDVCDAFINAVDARGSIRDEHLHRMPDIHLLVRRFTKNGGSKASLQDVVRLYQCSVRLPYMTKAVQNANRTILNDRFAKPLAGFVQELENFEALVETTIDLDQIDNGEFVINPKIDSQLAELRSGQDSLLADIAKEHQSVIRALRPPKDDSLKLERKDNAGYVFRVTRKDEKIIRGKSAYQVIDTRKDGVRFVTRSLKKLSAAYDDAAKEYNGKEGELRAKTLEVASTYMDMFLDIASLVAEMDVLASFATVSVGARDEYVRPTMTSAGTGLQLIQARHPMVEECLEEREFIANDMDLRRHLDGEDGSALLLITGPNTGGKSTYIRTAGVITLMAHIGCFVPAREATVPLTDRILCRVGAGDNMSRGVSTFMSEMLETATILRSATINSLIIIDELGRGTGVGDGYGLAYAISHHIVSKLRAATLFATHFHGKFLCASGDAMIYTGVARIVLCLS